MRCSSRDSMAKSCSILYEAFVKLLKKSFNGYYRRPTSTFVSTMHEDEEAVTLSATMEEEHLNKEYAPHMWSSRFPSPEEVLQHHIDFITGESEKASNTIPSELNIKYGSTFGQKLDILGTDLPHDAPILVFFPGGYWQHISREISRFPANSLYQAGIKTIVVGHALCPDASLWDIGDQVEEAAIYVFKYADIMKSRGVYLAGHCGGAHLVATVLSNSELLENTPGAKRLNGVFLISGIYDLRKFVDTSANDLVQLAKIDALSFSPQFSCTLRYLEHSKIRFFIMAADQDSPTFKKQTRDFYDVLHQICPNHTMHLEIKDDMDHYSIVECFANDDNYLKNLILHDIRKDSETTKN